MHMENESEIVYRREFSHGTQCSILFAYLWMTHSVASFTEVQNIVVTHISAYSSKMTFWSQKTITISFLQIFQS